MKKLLKPGWLSICLGCCLVCLSACQTEIEPRRMEVTIPEEIKSVAFSPDGERVAFGIEEDENQFVVVDGGAEEMRYEDITIPAFSPLGTDYFYAGKRDYEWYLVRNGRETLPIGGPTSLSQTTGLRLIGQYPFSVVVWRPLAIWFSEGSENYLLVSYLSGRGMIRKDGLPLELEFETFWHESFAVSPDGKRFCFAVRPQGRSSAVMYVDGQALSQQFDAVDSAFFLQPDNQLIYRARQGRQWILMVEDKAADGYPPLKGKIDKSPGEDHFAALVEGENNDRAVMVDGSQETTFRRVDWTSFAWQPEGAGHAYVVKTGVTELEELLKDETGDSGSAVVHNGTVLTTHPEIRPSSVSVSRNGEHVAYAASDGEGWVIVTDRNPGPSFEEVGEPVFSGSRAVYAAKSGEEWTVKGLETDQRFLQVGPLQESSFGEHVAYAAEVEPGLWGVFVDSELVSGPFEGIVQNTGIRFADSDFLKFVVKEQNRLVWMQVRYSK